MNHNEIIGGIANKTIVKHGIRDRHCAEIDGMSEGTVEKVMFETWTPGWPDPRYLELYAEGWCRDRVGRFEDGTYVLTPSMPARSFRVQ